MPAFDFNPTEASAGFIKLPEGDGYQFELGEPKSFARAGKNGKPDNFGVSFLSTVVGVPEDGDTKLIGKKYMINCMMHTEDTRGFSKQTQMAAYGYVAPKEEAEFDEVARSIDWKFNPDDKSCGDGWHKMSKQIIVQDIKLSMDNDGNPQNQSRNTRPLPGVSKITG